MKVAGYSQRAAIGSTSEAQACRNTIRLALGTAMRPESIAVITCKEQYRIMESYARNEGIGLRTVNSVQGRERYIVTLFTTRSHFEADRAELRSTTDAKPSCAASTALL